MMIKTVTSAQPERAGAHNRAVSFFADVLRGAAIGVAFIVPGFSGGSVAAILGIYERLVGAVADIFKHFKRSFLTLLPIALGLILGAAALILPIQWGVRNYPVPTVSLFVGLSIGGLPTIRSKAPGKPTARNAAAFAIPCLVAAALAFLPAAKKPEGFLYALDPGGYVILFLVGAVAASALVVPGISGSMLLLIFGYYAPLVSLITQLLLAGTQPAKSLLVLGVAGAGMLVGFFLVSLLMRYFLKKFPRSTYFAILGFITGSIVAVYAPFAKSAAAMGAWGWIVSLALLMLGIALSLALLSAVRKKSKKL